MDETLELATTQQDALLSPFSFFKTKPIIRRALKEQPARALSVPERVLAYRGVFDFNQSLFGIDKITPPDTLKGLDEVCAILYEAFQAQQRGQYQKIIVVGDFDVDGATSVVIALRGLRAMGFHIDFFIPDRFELGYGLSPAVVEAARIYEPTHLITVDNGIASVEGVQAAKSLGWKVIITDHHLAGDTIPAADAIVNPNQPGCQFPSKNLAGVGVIFYVLIGLRAFFRERGVPPHSLPHLAQMLDIVALGTVADVVPLDENNRRLVYLGLKRMRSGQACMGLQALAEVSGKSLEQVSETDLGFAFGPRLNAAGRLDDMSLGVKCLLSENWQDALKAAKMLDELNRQRRGIQQRMQEEADDHLVQYLNQHLSKKIETGSGSETEAIDESLLPPAMLMYQPDWHQGIVGLLASRLKERWHRPVIALAKVSETELKGSGRSIPGIHLRDALDIISKRAPNVLSKFGGHAMAAGLSLSVDRLDEFQQLFHEVMSELITPDLLAQRLMSDGELSQDELQVSLAMTLEQAGPWGQAFPEPVFDGEFKVLSCQWLKEKHLKLMLNVSGKSHQENTCEKNQSAYLEALYFNVPLNAYAADEQQAKVMFDEVTSVRCVYRLAVNRFRGQSRLQLLIDYLEPLS